MTPKYQQELGERLRAIRTQQNLTLQQVEERSDGRWKAVVVGSYERGDRAISVAKLAELARFYGVPVAELLPERPAVDPATIESPRLVLDLTRLSADGLDPTYEPVSRYATTIQLQRGDYNGRMLTLRTDDLRALAVVYGLNTDELATRLADEGILVGAA